MSMPARTFAAKPPTPARDPRPPARIEEPGRPLDDPTRASMEAAFGFDFSRVRVHAGRQAEESARALGARAYTLGQQIVFGAGEYQPHSEAGRRLLAHELTHVAQSAVGAATEEAPPIAAAGDAAEQEAEQSAADVLTGVRPRVRRGASRAIFLQRQQPQTAIPRQEVEAFWNAYLGQAFHAALLDWLLGEIASRRRMAGRARAQDRALRERQAVLLETWRQAAAGEAP